MNIEKIYSKLEEDRLLHIVHRIKNAADTPRNDLIESDNFIQCSFLKLKKDSTFRPHKHIFKKRKYENQIAQESWVVIKGKVECTFYDEDDTLVYEYKTGPYEGQKYDKQFI